MKRGTKAVLSCAIGAMSLLGTSAQSEAAAVFAPGSIILLRAGDGVASTDNHAPVAIQEYSQAGGPAVETISLSSSDFTIDRGATSDGTLSWSADNRYLMFGGYDNDAGTGDSSDSFGSGNKRMGARIDNDLVLGSATPIYNQLGGMGNQIRGYLANNTTHGYVSNSSGSPRRVDNTATTGNGTILVSNGGSRQISIFGGDLYASYTTAAPGRGIFKFTGVPTAANATPTLLVAGDSDDEFQSFFLADLDAGVAGLDTMWATNLGANNDTIHKWSLVGGVWVSNGSIAAGGIRNIAGFVEGGVVSLFGAAPSTVSRLNDIGGYNAAINGTLTAIPGITAGANNTFKGIQVIVPEPTSLAMLALGGVGLLARRRTR